MGSACGPRNGLTLEMTTQKKMWLAANQNSGNIVVFSIDGKTGRLTPVGKPMEIPSPTCLKMIP